ncbi:hypothetical protein OG369_19840 [Streptomyces sp. NBC_01221]|uniref:hypothetical protein n=1 Tax=Streptomyces sp. NBC_01221 TaxID=2903782 RepID=UPI002251A9A9|nr:hypothetical protein [Streptomyces sp. NBC_01221]MCX4788334.1 hypothetical protein [Streptomyces sp. NBC_01221]
MANTEPESNSEVSAAAETSEEAVPEAGTETGAGTPKPAAATSAPPTAGSAKVTESGAGSSQGAAVVLAGGVIGAEVPAAARVTESTAPTLAPTPDPKAAKEPKTAKAATASSTPAAEPVAAEKSGPQAVAQPAPAPEPATEPVATAAASVPEATAATTTASATTAATTSRGLPALTAVLGTLTRTRTRTRTASATTAITTDGAGNGPEGVGAKDEGPAPGKVSRPMVAAAVIGGVVLLSLPFVVASSTGGDGPKHNSRNTAAGYTDPAPGTDGYVPQADASKGPLGKGSPKAPGGTAGTTGGVNAPPIIEAASADNVGGSGELSTGTKAGDKAPKDKAGDKAPKDKAGDKTTQTKTGDKTTQTKTGSDSGKQTETKTDPSTGNGAATTPQKPAASPTVLFSAVGGLHCTSSAVTFTERGKYTDGQKGWTTHDGSYAAGGCNGWYRSIPMSGDSNDSDNSVVWNFRTGDVSSGSCKVSVYIPNDSNIGHVGGQPTYYTVHDGTSTAGSTQLGHFTITQVSHLGQWIAAPSYKINSGVLSVKLHDRGDDWSSSSRANAHHAAAPIRVECTK